MHVLKLNSIEDPFEISKRPFHPYNILALGWPRDWENVCWSSRDARTLFCRHLLLQSMISLKPESQIKNREIPILADRKSFPMSYGRASETLYGVCSTCLKCLYVRPHCVQTCVTSNKHISQTRKQNEIPWNTHLSWRKYLSDKIW